MPIATRRYTKTHSFEWDERRLSIHFKLASSVLPFSAEYKTNTASFEFTLQVPGGGPHTFFRSMLFDKLDAFQDFESTESWQGICFETERMIINHGDARDFIRRALCAEMGDSLRKAAALEHSVMAVTVDMKVTALAADHGEYSDVDVGSDEDDDSSPRMRSRGRRPRDFCGACGQRLVTRELRLGCKHSYHLDCYNSWWRISHQCLACGPQVNIE